MATDDSSADAQKLVEIWKVLETLAVSMDRVGQFWLAHGENAAKDALHEYMNPALVQRIAHARRLIIEVLEAQDETMGERLETLSEQDDGIGYWNGPSWMTKEQQ